jgi:elongation factor Ts
MSIGAMQVKELRERTGLPMMECKRALEETGGDQEKATEVLRRRGLKVADKKAHREMAEGLIASYVHHNDRIGVLVELTCETDFVAKSDDFRAFARDVCMHIAWADPACVRREELDPELVQRERDIVAETLKKVPEDKREKAVEGKLAKSLYAEKVLLDQPFTRDDSKTVGGALKELVAKLRENISIRRFSRLQLGG